MEEEFWNEDQLLDWLAKITGRKRKTRRTLRNYRNRPNGLPYIMAGQHVIFNPPSARAWLLSTERQRNPTKRSGRPRGPARRDRQRIEAESSP